MAYTTLKNKIASKEYTKYSLEYEALRFVRERCEGLRFDSDRDKTGNVDRDGKSIRPNQIPYNMEKDIDRLCMEKAIARFLKTGKKEDAFDVYFCYLEMFVGDYEKTRRMIELLSEFEANGSGLLMKHRDHYAHSVYVFCLGLAIYESNSTYRKSYKKFYDIDDENQAACHYLQYWGLASLFHDIGYPFELPFEQVCSYFEVDGNKRDKRPFMAYQELGSFTTISKDKNVKARLKELIPDRSFKTTDELFAYILADKLGKDYSVDEKQMQGYLEKKPVSPNMFGYFMDHAYFSATVLFKKLFEEMGCSLEAGHLDALTTILMHNSFYKFCIANPNRKQDGRHLSYKEDGNIPFKAEVYPLAYMLMLCDKLQCWDRTAYGRNSKKELHPMGCTMDLSGDSIKIIYLFDERDVAKVERFKDEYIAWLQLPKERREEKDAAGKMVYPQPGLKAYSGMFIKRDGTTVFQSDIERIVDLTEIKMSGMC